MIGLSIPFLLLIAILLALVFGGRKARWMGAGLFCLLVVGVLFLFGVRQATESRVAVKSVDMPGLHVSDDSVDMPGLHVSNNSVDMPGLHVAHDPVSGSDTIDMPGLHVSDNSRTASHTIDMPGLHVANSRSSNSSKHRVVVEAPVLNVTPQVPPTPHIYQPGDSYVDPNERYADRSKTDQLEPDAYPSVASAAIGCARQVLKHQGEVVRDGVTVRSIVIPSSSIAAGEVRSMVQKEFGWLKVLSEPPAASRPSSPNEANAELVVSTSTYTVGGTVVSHATLLRARFYVPGGGATTRDAKALDKDWVEDLAAWQNQMSVKGSPNYTPREGELIVVDPPFLSANPLQVENRTISDAAARIAEVVSNQPILQNKSLSALPGFIESELRRHKLIRDEFLQRFERPYGVVYRKALLIDVSDDQIQPLANQYAAVAWANSQHLNRSWASLAGLVLLIVVVYLFLNAATKGYYVWSLRLGSVAMIAAGIYTIMRLRS